MHPAIRVLLHASAALFGALAIVFGLAAWRLSWGPVSLAFLRPYIEQALEERYPAFVVRFDDLVLTWAGWRRTLDVRALNVQVSGAKDEPLASVPEVALGLSGRALLLGEIQPTSIEMIRPTIRLLRDVDGAVVFQMGTPPGGGEAPLEQLLADLVSGGTLGAEGAREPLRQLGVLDAELLIEDRLNEVTWHASGADVNLYHAEEGITGNLSVDVHVLEEPSHVAADIVYDRAARTLEFDIWIDNVHPARMAAITPHLSGLEALDTPLSGRLDILLDPFFQLSSLDFDLTGGPGRISLPTYLASDLEVSSLRTSGRILDRFHVLELHLLSVDVGGPQLTVSGRFTESREGVTVDAEFVLEDLPVGQVDAFWPKDLVPNSRRWVMENLSDGMLRRMSTRVVSEPNEAAPRASLLEGVTGEVELENVTLNYLETLPEIRGADAGITFGGRTIDLEVTGGRILERLGIEGGGRIVIGGLEGGEDAISIDAVITGPTASLLEVIDHPRLGYPSHFGIDPATVGGSTETRFHFDFPLIGDLALDQIAVRAVWNMRDFSMSDVVDGYDVTGGNLELTLEEDGLDIEGPLLLNGVPFDLVWRENFREGEDFLSRCVLSGEIDDQGRVALKFSAEPYLVGPVKAELIYTDIDRRHQTVSLQLDTMGAALSFPELLWSKPPGENGMVQLLFRREAGALEERLRFLVRGPDFTAEGEAAFGPRFAALKRADVTRLAYGSNELTGSLTPLADGGYAITVGGESLDIRPFIDRLFVDEAGATVPFNLDLNVRRLITRADQQITDASARVEYQDESWRYVALDGRLPSGEILHMRLRPVEGDRRQLTMTSNDAGSTARVFDVFNNAIGGKLEIEATIYDNEPARPMKGLVRITNYRVIKAPILAQLLNYASLFGLFDRLQGEGISFTNFRLPFTLVDGKLTVEDAHTAGPSLGINADGVVDLEANEADLKGTIVPAYLINALIGNIPLIGDLLVGGKGEGIIAARFSVTGSLDEPSISVNPVSMLTPGFLRHIFDVFEGSGEKRDSEEQPDSEKSSPAGRRVPQ